MLRRSFKIDDSKIYQQLSKTKILHLAQVTHELLSTRHMENIQGEVLSCVHSVSPRYLFLTSQQQDTVR